MAWDEEALLWLGPFDPAPLILLDDWDTWVQSKRILGRGLSALGLPRPLKKSEVIARDIIRGIVEDELEPAAPLPAEAVMARRYAVGRASVREALRLLESQGLIEIKQGHQGGPSVGSADSARLASMMTLYFQLARVTYEDVGQCLLVLDATIAGLAAANVKRRKRHLKMLQACVGFCGDAHPPEELTTSLGDFHATLRDMAANDALGLLAAAVSRIYLDHVMPTVDLREFHKTAADEHVGIAAAIEAGDVERAETLMRQHMGHMLRYASDQVPGVLKQTVDWR